MEMVEGKHYQVCHNFLIGIPLDENCLLTVWSRISRKVLSLFCAFEANCWIPFSCGIARVASEMTIRSR